MIKVKILKDGAKIPIKAHDNDAGYDLFAFIDNDKKWISIGPKKTAVIPTGISIALPDTVQGFSVYGRIAPRSGLAIKNGIDVFAGVVDAGYRGELMVCLFNASTKTVRINHEDRVAQLIPEIILKGNIQIIKELDDTNRGEKGFGSSGQ